MQVRGFHQVATYPVAKIQKKSVEKSYLDKFGGLRNMRNRSGMLELLFLMLKNNSELLLSPEIGQFEVEEVDFLENPYISLCTDNRDLTGSPLKIMKNRPLQLQIDLSRRSRRVRKCS